MKKKIVKGDNVKNLAIIGIIIMALLALLFLSFGLLFGGNQQNVATSSAASEQNRANFDLLKSMSEKTKNLEFNANYTVTFDPKIRNDTSFHKYYSKSGDFRIDINEGNSSLQMYKLGDNTYACSEAGGNMTCFFVGDVEDLGSDSALNDIERNLGSYDISISEDRIILGMGATCFTIKVKDFASPLGSGYAADDAADMAIENCFSRDGIPLEASSAFSKMTLTSLSRKVPDSAFVLPSEPIVMNETG
jgi:hypothetical protein